MRKGFVGMAAVLLMLALSVSGGVANEDADLLNAMANMLNAFSALEEAEEHEEIPEPSKKASKENAAKQNWSSGKTVEVEIAGKKVEVHESLKEAMDQYEELFDQYIEFMEDDGSSMTAYASALTKYAEAMEAIDGIDEDELTDGDYAYYMEVLTRVNQKLLLAEP